MQKRLLKPSNAFIVNKNPSETRYCFLDLNKNMMAVSLGNWFENN